MPHILPPSTLAVANLTFLLALAAAFAAAFVGGAIAVRLKQSPIVGYLLAGLIIGPFTPGFNADTGTTQRVADVGVILLLFGVVQGASILCWQYPVRCPGSLPSSERGGFPYPAAFPESMLEVG